MDEMKQDEMPDEFVDEKSGMRYIREGDYYVPALTIQDATTRPIGKYGRMRRAYLESYDKAMLGTLLLQEKLMEHLADVQEEATAKVELLIQQMLSTDPAPDKATHQMEWVQHMNNLKAVAEEIVMKELIYS